MTDVKFSQFTAGNEMQIGDEPVGLRPSSPTQNFIFNFPGTGIKDANGNYLFQYATAGAAAVNNLKFVNSLTTVPVEITATGTDSNIGININTVGTGVLSLNNFQWPTNDGSAGYVLTTNGSRVLSFTASTFPPVPGPAGTIPRSNGSAWVASTSTFANTYGASQLLYSNGANTVIGLTTANSATLVTNSSGVPAWTSSMTNGQVLIGSTGATPTPATLTAGTGVTITNSAGGISIASTGGVAITFDGDSGSATPSANTITISGGSTGLTTSATSATVSLTGTLNLASGGTNHNLTASNGGIVYSDASKLDILSGTATANQILLSGSSTAPTWSTNTYPSTDSKGDILYASAANTIGGLGIGSTGTILTVAAGLPAWTTATYPSTTTINQLLYSSANNTVAGLATATTAVLTTSSGVPTWASELSMALGGTNANLTASNGGIFYSTASAGAILSGTATAQQLLMSGASTTPQWSTSTYPLTNAANTLLYASSANTMAALATANSAVLVTNSSGVPAWSGTMTNGQLIIGNTSGTPTAATITAGNGIAITNGGGSITISSTDAAATWTVVTGTSQSMSSNNGYISNNAGLVTMTLPSTANVGDIIEVVGLGAGGWKIAQNASQLIHVGSSVTTTGTGGSVASTNQYDSITIVCAVANTTWINVNAPQSSGLTIV